MAESVQPPRSSDTDWIAFGIRDAIVFVVGVVLALALVVPLV